MTTLLVSFFTLAALESLNPTAIALQLYLLSTPKPIVRSATFIFGVFVAYWTAGLLFALGLAKVITNVVNSIGWFIYVIEFIIGLVLIAIGWTLNPSSAKYKTIKHPKSLKPIRTFLLGVALTLGEFPMAIPYIAAIEQLVRAKLDLPELMLALFLYNLIFISPLIVLLAISVFLQDRSTALLNKIYQQVMKWFPKVLQVLLVILGLVLVVDCIAASLNHLLL